ncbi:MAG: hypothetical protein QOC66_154 [Pseudonocardiales bacterium]|nr:hypothetical protein [Pseudonocardiales bacterium]
MNTSGQLPKRPTLGAMTAWAGVAILLSLALLTPFTIGPIAALLACPVLVVLLRRHGGDGSAVAALVGAGAFPLVIAYLNRHGPGDFCTRTASSESCEEQWSPWPWAVVGVALIVAGLAGCLRLRAGNRRHGPPASEPAA